MKKKLRETELENDELEIEKSIIKFHKKKIALENLAKALCDKSMKEMTKSDKSNIL
ncbi:MAG: hypothetical protein K9H16_08570 [Bacteroidales bacterium]|nr:hypothetical protein [Bacteroidales bacterium]